MEKIKNCIKCNRCVNECKFLTRYGNPQEIKEKIDKNISISFECSLCGLCEVVCKKNVKFTKFILSKREEAVKKGIAPLKEHKKILNFEKYAASSIFKVYNIPKNAKKVFFPGCAFSGNSPEFVISIFNKLNKNLPEPVGIIIDCCFKISHDIGMKEKFLKKTEEKIKVLTEHGIEEIITSCGSCTDIFRKYMPFKISTIYEFLKNEKLAHNLKNVNVHDPCTLRNDSLTQNSIRKILENSNIKIIQMEHEKEKTFCCGEGGAAGFINKIYSKSWKSKRLKEATYPIIVYCYGCKLFLRNRKLKVYHILDLIYKNNKTPGIFEFWINKLKLKIKLKRKNFEI